MLTDSNGQPLSGLQVRALPYPITPPAGDRELVPIPGTPILTDDRGVYRIFGLPAGEYARGAAAAWTRSSLGRVAHRHRRRCQASSCRSAAVARPAHLAGPLSQAARSI